MSKREFLSFSDWSARKEGRRVSQCPGILEGPGERPDHDWVVKMYI